MSVDLETHQHVLRLWLHLRCGGGICGEEEDRPRRIGTDYVLTRKKDTKSDLFICWYFYWFALLNSTTSVDCNNTTKIKTREIQNCVCSCQSFDFFKKNKNAEAVFRRQNLSRVSFSLLPLSRSLNYPERGGEGKPSSVVSWPKRDRRGTNSHRTKIGLFLSSRVGVVRAYNHT